MRVMAESNGVFYSIGRLSRVPNVGEFINFSTRYLNADDKTLFVYEVVHTPTRATLMQLAAKYGVDEWVGERIKEEGLPAALLKVRVALVNGRTPTNQEDK